MEGILGPPTEVTNTRITQENRYMMNTRKLRNFSENLRTLRNIRRWRVFEAPHLDHHVDVDRAQRTKIGDIPVHGRIMVARYEEKAFHAPWKWTRPCIRFKPPV